jgi:hypothetical protein
LGSRCKRNILTPQNKSAQEGLEGHIEDAERALPSPFLKCLLHSCSFDGSSQPDIGMDMVYHPKEFISS